MMIITKPNRNKMNFDRYISILGWFILSVLIGIFGAFIGCIGLGIINF